ncbi:hypothetical protein L6R53_21995 [Myxococcota bacterium]|nr:hypothetical protein [Myxococcota bacterium]
MAASALLLALGLLGCDLLADTLADTPVALPAASDASPGAGRAASGQPPLYVVLYTHHYLGLGGYYPSAAQVRAVAEACVEADMAADCVLHFDGILVEKLSAEDPTLDDYVRDHDFPIGYHGEEAHGPYPVVVTVQQLNLGKDSLPEQSIVQAGASFDQAVDLIHHRYTHGYSGPRLDAQGYLSRQSGGQSSERPGGIARVEDWTGADPQILPGHALFQPAATLAFQREADIALLQAAGPFAPHFLKGTRNPELAERVAAFLGQPDTLFWYMGQLAEKASEHSSLPMWSAASLVQRAGKGGVDGRMWLGPHLLPTALLDGFRAAWAQAPAARPPKKQALDGARPTRQGPGRGEGTARDGRSNQEIKQQVLAGQGAAAAGEEVRRVAADQDRSRGRMVSMKIDGSKDEVAAALAFLRQWADREGVQLVSPRELRERVAPSRVQVEAKAAAAAVLASWSAGPADSLVVGGQPLSQADAFEVMARHLAGEGDRISTTDVLGPMGAASSLPQGRGTVTVEQVRLAARAAARAIEDHPHHAMPVHVEVGGQAVGFHQLHWLMAQVIARGATSLELPQAEYAPPFAGWLADRLGRSNPDSAFWMECQYWTIKPAVLR